MTKPENAACPVRLLLAEPHLRQAVAEQLQIAGWPVLADSADIGDSSITLIDDAALVQFPAPPFPVQAGHYVLHIGGNATSDAISESLSQPIRLGQLLDRVRHYSARPPQRASAFTFGPYKCEPQLRQIQHRTSGVLTRLTEKETELLVYLSQKGVAVSREELLAAVWGYEAGIETHTLDTHIYQLRRKLENDGVAPLLVNEQGAYRLNDLGGSL